MKKGLLVTGGSDGCVVVWDLATLLCITVISRLDSPIACVSLSYDGSLIAYCGEGECTVEVCNAITGHSLISVPVEVPVSYVGWSPVTLDLGFAGGRSKVGVGKLGLISFEWDDK